MHHWQPCKWMNTVDEYKKTAFQLHGKEVWWPTGKDYFIHTMLPCPWLAVWFAEGCQLRRRKKGRHQDCCDGKLELKNNQVLASIWHWGTRLLNFSHFRTSVKATDPIYQSSFSASLPLFVWMAKRLSVCSLEKCDIFVLFCLSNPFYFFNHFLTIPVKILKT